MRANRIETIAEALARDLRTPEAGIDADHTDIRRSIRALDDAGEYITAARRALVRLGGGKDPDDC
jgi:hypothetical protein